VIVTNVPVLRTHQPDWWRGPARAEGEWISLDASRAEVFQPLSESDLLFDLANVRRPDDAVAFVRRYGLLHLGPGSSEPRERFSAFLSTAYTLTRLLGLHQLIRGGVAGDKEALRTLWEVVYPWLAPALEPQPETDEELLIGASQALAALLSDGLAGVELRMNSDVEWRVGPDGETGRPDGFRLAPQIGDLVGLAYYELALHITERMPMAACGECERFFIVDDPRRRFCSTTCANRSRRRRWRERREPGGDS
jgi:hypothetical protein